VHFAGLTGGKLPPQGPPLRVDARRARNLGTGRGRALSSSCSSASPARASRRSPAKALQADRGDLLGLLPRPGRRRRERPVRHPGRVRAAALHRRQAARRAACSPWSTRRTCSPRPAAAGRCWPASTTCSRWPSCWTCRRRCAPSGTPEPSGPRLRPARDPPPARCQLRRLRKGCDREGFRTVHVLHSRSTTSPRRPSRQPLFNDLRHETRAVRRHRRRPRLPTPSWSELLGSSATQIDRDAAGRPVGASHPDRRASSSATWSTAAPTPRRAAPGHGHGGAGHAFCVPGNHEAKLLRALRGKNVQASPTAWPSRWRSSPPSPRSSGRGRRFIDGLVSHYVLDGGRLVVAHAGLKSSATRAAPRAGSASSACTGRPPARPTSTACRSATRGPGVPRQGDGRLRPHPGARGRVAEQHHVPGHRLRLRWQAHRAALPGARARLRPGRRVYYEPARPFPAAGPTAARRAHAASSSRRARGARHRATCSARRTRTPRSRS
jgi:hypothetical protein